MNVPARFRNALLAVGLAAAVGCSSDDPKSPTAPPTTPVTPVTPVTYAVTVSPSKSVLTVNTSEFANVTITAARTDNGAPPANLTKVDADHHARRLRERGRSADARGRAHQRPGPGRLLSGCHHRHRDAARPGRRLGRLRQRARRRRGSAADVLHRVGVAQHGQPAGRRDRRHPRRRLRPADPGHLRRRRGHGPLLERLAGLGPHPGARGRPARRRDPAGDRFGDHQSERGGDGDGFAALRLHLHERRRRRHPAADDLLGHAILRTERGRHASGDQRRWLRGSGQGRIRQGLADGPLCRSPARLGFEDSNRGPQPSCDGLRAGQL